MIRSLIAERLDNSLLFRKMILKRSMKHIGNGVVIKGRIFFKNKKYISIGNNFSCLWNTRIEAWDRYFDQSFTPEIIIGDNVSFNSDVHIGCIDKVIIGNNVLLASRIFISDHSHGDINTESIKMPPLKRPLVSKGPVVIEDNVWIGEGVSILAGVTIGENSIVGSNAVVTTSFPKNSVIGGIPARLLKTL